MFSILKLIFFLFISFCVLLMTVKVFNPKKSNLISPAFSAEYISNCVDGKSKSEVISLYKGTELVNFLSANHNVYLITKDCDNCDLNFLESNVKVIHCNPKDYIPKNVLPNFDVIISNYWTSGIFCKLNLSKSK